MPFLFYRYYLSLYLNNEYSSRSGYHHHCLSEAAEGDETKKRYWYVIGPLYVTCDIVVFIMSLIYLIRLHRQLCSKNRCCKFREIPSMEYNYDPKPLAKILAFIVPGLFLFAASWWVIIETQYVYCIMPWQLWWKLENVPSLAGNIVYYFYYWFLTSMLKSYMKINKEFRDKIPTPWLFYVIRAIIVINFIAYAGKTYIHYQTDGGTYWHGWAYLDYYLATNATSSTLIDASLLYVYTRGLKNVCNFYSKRHRHADNQWAKQIHKIISRCRVTMFVSASCNITLIGYDVWHYYGPDTQNGSEIYLTAFGEIFWSILVVVNTITYLWTVYIIFPFGQQKYDCLFQCCQCDKKMEQKSFDNYVQGYEQPNIKRISINDGDAESVSTDTYKSGLLN